MKEVSCLGVVPCTGKATNQKGSTAMCVVSESVFYLIFFFVQGLLFSKGKIENFLLEERRLEKRRGVCVNKYVFQMSHAPNPITLEGPASPDCSHLPFYWER